MEESTKQYVIIIISILLGFFISGLYNSTISYFFPEPNFPALIATNLVFIFICLVALTTILNYKK